MMVLPRLLRIIEEKRVLVFLIIPNWPRRIWNTDILRFLADGPWPLPNRPNLLSQGPLFHPAFPLLALTAWLFETEVLKDRGISDSVGPSLLSARKMDKIYLHTWKTSPGVRTGS